MRKLFVLAFVWLLTAAVATNPEEGSYFEGDIIEPLPSIDERSGLIDIRYRWPDNTLPYRFDVDFPEDFRTIFLSGLNHLAGRTCIRFRERTTETDYVNVWQGSGCSSSVGRRGGSQNLSLATGCYRFGTHVHEVIHAIGFYHEQSRTDRDDFVIINWDNIEPGKEHNFDKRNASIVSPFDVPYDYGSLMHYSKTAFSDNGLDTIVTRDPNAVIGQRVAMSNSDWEKVNNMYCPRTLGIQIQNVFDNLNMQVNNSSGEGSPIVTGWEDDSENERWTVQWDDLQIPSLGSSIVSWSQDGGSIKSMTENSNSTAILSGYTNATNQIWTIREIGDNNPWQIINSESGRCLYSEGEGQVVRSKGCDTADRSQLWNIYQA